MSNDTERYIEFLAGNFYNQGMFFSIHRKILYASGEFSIPGSVFTDATKAAQIAQFWAGGGHDIYLAMGGELAVGKTEGRKYPQAIRKRYNVGACSALYMDLDVKENAYTTQENALGEFENFVLKYELPKPSMMVSSGTGGVHVYWVADELFPPAEHEMLSSSLVSMGREFKLKFDHECSIDLCRLLRPPGTWNFKTDPASPVGMLYFGSNVPLVHLRERLNGGKGNGASFHATTSSSTPADDNDDLLLQKKQYPLADFAAVQTFCEFLHNTSMTGGKQHNEAIWKQTVSLASFCENGRELAHSLSKGHGAYSQSETDFKYDQAETDKKNNPKLGPSKCSTLKALGVKECDTCLYFNLNTTPINVPNFQQKPKVTPPYNPNADLPLGYFRKPDSTIWYEGKNKDGETEQYQVFSYPMIFNSAYVESGEEYSFCFTTLEGNNHPKIVRMPLAATATRDGLVVALSKNGLPAISNEITRRFFVALQSLLRNKDETLVTSNPIGWHKTYDGEIGFAYDGVCYLPGKTVKAQLLPLELSKAYSKTGDSKYWQELSELVINQNRPGINVIIACGFAAPLIALTGHSGVAIGAWSSESGIGKTTALSIAQAIWGSTGRMLGLEDTANAAIDTMATLKNAVLCWDEIRGRSQTEKMVSMIFMLSRGKEKGRLTKNVQQAQQREFEALLVWAANNSLMDEIAKATSGTMAGHYRVFEFEVDPFITNLNVGHVSNLTSALRRNYGHIGERYAKFLGENRNKILNWVTQMRDKIDVDLQTTQAERYWSAAAAALIVGARIANGLKFTNFDLPTFENFVYNKIKQSRILVGAATGDFAKLPSVELQLGEFLLAMNLNTIKTDITLNMAGRPPKGAVKVLNDNVGFTRQTVYVQISEKERICRIADPALSKWSRDHGVTKSAFTSALEKHFKAKAARGRIGAGTDYSSVPLLVWELNLKGTAIGDEIEF
jgi:Domain of unknown function (DUF927)